ncbi:YafY family transcriptional regulator [Nesterenkonia sp. E16_7]|uniref:helix-turn-helix transcriptional regulator n=1 Tax=unclassified Nesterenkonia TaxID=2629769 RepID=UPI001A939364|nr:MULTISPECIES: YafY family protein [unclassified Nesterenkonia]MBO0594993.1 YafY family transcriptional regulator [Nesterenkonia sp. E16_10]MBO0598648.1 YafY family transcriptional regulator [Nesterenkonia sp. E16_7]
MSRTTGRTLELLGLLQARSAWTGAELRARLEVSDRTLRRDIEDLRNLGYGIEATRGVGGGYRLGAGAVVPPLTLARDEAVAIAVGLRAGASGVITGIEDSAARALAKLELSLAPVTRDQIAAVERAMVPLVAARGDVDVETVIALARAIADRREIRIRYRNHAGEHSERTVQPHRIVHTAERWYLIAWEPQRLVWRTLRVDRIERVRRDEENFELRQIPDDLLRQATTRAISTAPYPVRARVLVHAQPEVVRATFGPTVAEVFDAGEGTSVLVTGADRAEVIVMYLGTSGLHWELLEGDEVRQALLRLAEEFSAAARR